MCLFIALWYSACVCSYIVIKIYAYTCLSFGLRVRYPLTLKFRGIALPLVKIESTSCLPGIKTILSWSRKCAKKLLDRSSVTNLWTFRSIVYVHRWNVYKRIEYITMSRSRVQVPLRRIVIVSIEAAFPLLDWTTAKGVRRRRGLNLKFPFVQRWFQLFGKNFRDVYLSNSFTGLLSFFHSLIW